MACVTAWERMPARPAHCVPWPAEVDQRIVAAAHEMGVVDPYSHQAQAISSALGGEHVIMATSTASGKTLGYNIPVLQAMLGDPGACALYLFPTKALAHDQVAALRHLADAVDSVVAISPYDGDTPRSQRPQIRRTARLLITNPDMLHTGILPHHTRWARFFGNLRYVILDELHTYRGVFGAHVANLLRRLQRICAFYGATPTFIAASATIANPRELAERLLAVPVTLIDDDGSPQGERHVILYNPPLVDPQLGLRRSASLCARDIAARFLDHQVQSILFARARLTTEVILSYLRDTMAASGQDPSIIKGYRGGYLPSERRAIERGLRMGDVLGVVATNALELGVDIGRLSACVMAGYPGTIASFWQQAGRAGRRADLSAAVLVASAMPMDQYLVTHPRYFFGRPIENALLDPDNLAILASHLACAAFELPFERGESFGELDHVVDLLDLLAEEGAVHSQNGRYTWIGEGYPATALSLRSSTSDNVIVQNVAADPPVVIGTIDRPSAPKMVHEGAVYLHAAETFVVEALDWERGVAAVKPVSLDTYTRASATTDVRVLETIETDLPQERTAVGARRGRGEIMVTTRVTGYRTLKRYTHEVLAHTALDLPEQTMRTVGYWLVLDAQLTDQLQERGLLPKPPDYGPDWDMQRDAARRRDGFHCRECGLPEREGRQHDVHHITPFRSFGYVPGQNEFYRAANRLDNLITLCSSCHRRVEQSQRTRSALSGIAYVLRSLAPLHLMCDPGDLGSVVQMRAPDTRLPTVTLYDETPGGAGLTPQLYELHADLLDAALDQVAHCPCTDGCPACVGPVADGQSGLKRSTEETLRAIIGDDGTQPDELR